MLVVTIAQKELRNNVGEILRRAERGERFTITVSGRAVAELGPTRRRAWVNGASLGELRRVACPEMAAELTRFGSELTDPFAG